MKTEKFCIRFKTEEQAEEFGAKFEMTKTIVGEGTPKKVEEICQRVAVVNIVKLKNCRTRSRDNRLVVARSRCLWHSLPAPRRPAAGSAGRVL